MRSRHSMSRAVCPSSSSGTVTIRDMMTILGNPQYGPRMNPPAPPRRQNRQPRRSEAEPRWVVVGHLEDALHVLVVPGPAVIEGGGEERRVVSGGLFAEG